MCDVAHAMLVEQVEGDARASWGVQAALAAAGAQVDEITPHEVRERLEKALDGDTMPDGMDPEQWALRQALGVA